MQKTGGVPRAQHIDKVVEILVVMQRQVPMISKVQESADVPVLIVLERQEPTIKTEEKREVDVLVVTQRQRLMVQRKVEIPLAGFIDEIVDGVKRVPHERVVGADRGFVHRRDGATKFTD